MAKETHYKVSGTVTTKPGPLPHGLKVEEVTVDVETTAKVCSKYGTNFEFKSYLPEVSGVGKEFVLRMSTDLPSIKPNMGDKLFSREEIVSLRDQLTALLDETGPALRVFKDRGGSWTSRWWEVAPDKFMYASTRESAERHYAKYPSDAWSFAKVDRDYGPLTLVSE